jgi:cellulose synthase/poly-beta-1,6-N-acetylglucosamine synthase-like glycosyltransferase
VNSQQHTTKEGPAKLHDGQQIQSNWRETLAEPHGFVWYTGICISTVGVVGIGIGNRFIVFLGLALIGIGGSVLALLALATEFRLAYATETRSSTRLVVVAISAILFIATVAISSDAIPTGSPLNVRIVILTLGVQVLFLTTDVQPPESSRRARLSLLLFSHGTLLAASSVTVSIGPQNFRGALLLYVVGFSFLALHAFWSRQLRPGVSPPRPRSRRRYWESLLLVAIIVGCLTAIFVVFTTPPPRTVSPTLSGRFIPSSLKGRVGAIVIGEAGVIALAILGVPDRPPKILASLTGPLSTIFQHVFALLVLNNALLLGIFVIFPQAFTWALSAVLLVLTISITINYLSIGYNRWLRSGAATPAEEPSEFPLTVIVPAANEADILRKTLPHNLAVLSEAEFLLVPAENSTDGTHDVMSEMKNIDPERVRIIEGTSGSKPGDLNEVWPHIKTTYALLLDADETVTPDAIDVACQKLEEEPDVGIVQGRKVAAYPDASALSKFVTVERQHSTWIHHPFMAGVLDAGHFAGSAAVVRREAVQDIEGFATDMLTEDIDLTVRLYLETDWELVYEPDMIIRELNPETWQSLIRQRERWARGWAQVATRHLEDIGRSPRKLGLRRTIGLCWELFTAISSPVYTLLPAFVIFWLFITETPVLVFSSQLFTLYLLVERGVSFFVAAYLDPDLPHPEKLRTVVATGIYGYAWMLFGWVIQLHSLYLELAGATGFWDVTEKQPEMGDVSTERSRQLITQYFTK